MMMMLIFANPSERLHYLHLMQQVSLESKKLLHFWYNNNDDDDLLFALLPLLLQLLMHNAHSEWRTKRALKSLHYV